MSVPMNSPQTGRLSGRASAAFTVISPGRVNLIGEHTDYNDGLVLPMAIEPHVRIDVFPRQDLWMELSAGRRDEAPVRFDLTRAIAPSDCSGSWSAYPCGVVAGFQRLGWQIPGFEARVSATLPVGAGLSSSAALEIGVATAIEVLCQTRLTLEEKALLAQHAEHEFAGVPCGIMDQFAVTFGRAGFAMLLDCRARTLRYVELRRDSVSVLVINSGVKHKLADGAYAKRRSECGAAAKLLGVSSLREVDSALWESKERVLPDVERRRARHVITEHRRTMRFAAALEDDNFEVAGEEMYGSHASLRDDYEVSCEELDLLVEEARGIEGVFGCRMTGGGFGGCAVALIQSAKAEAIQEAFRRGYRKVTGIEPTTFVTKAANGAALLG
jgi:galactokinase